MRWSDRLLGIVSTLILARLLTPADFGLVAMAMIAVGLIEVLLDLGVATALVQNRDADRHDFDTAWTLRLAEAGIAGVALFAAAPLVAGYFNDDRITDLLRVITLTLLIGGFENIGIVRFQKDMEFGREFQFFVTRKVLATLITITAAVVFRSYWALVIGSLAGRAIGVALSYAWHPYRPRFDVSRTRQIWSFSQWNILMSIASYLYSRLDKVVVGRVGGASTMGAYTLGDEIASLPTTEFLAPVGRVMFPSFVNARADPTEFARIVTLAFSLQALIGVPAGAGIALVAPEAIPLLLGQQWHEAVPIVQILGFVGVLTALGHSAHYMLLSLGRIRTLAFIYLVQFFALLTIVTTFEFTNVATNVAQSRLAVAAIGLAMLQVCARLAFPALSFRSLMQHVWRPCIAVLLMIGAVASVAPYVENKALAFALAAKIGVGAAVYGIAIYAAWRASGRPVGPEAYLLDKLQKRFNFVNTLES